MALVGFDYQGASAFISEKEIEYLLPYAKLAQDLLRSGAGQGADFLGWAALPDNYDKSEFERIKSCAAKIREDSDVLVVIGIGGSYLGARAAIDAISNNFNGMLDKASRGGALTLYAGNNLSSAYMADLLSVLENREVSLNVISKSGTTTEPAVAFRFLKEFMEAKYGRAGAAGRIYATTDKNKGALISLARTEGYETFTIPDNIGGRYSVLTAVGLLPLAAAGVDIDAMMAGAREESRECGKPEIGENHGSMYAITRNALYRKGYATELLINYEPNLHYFSEWWKQLFGESEGKDHKGIFPAAADFTGDLHSMGQFIQDGTRNLFETVVDIRKPGKNLTLSKTESDIDGLNFLAGRDIDHINKMAAKGTYEAHIAGGAPNLRVSLQALDAKSIGGAIYFFEWACAVSGYLMGVNPFDQPGVELYKTNMFRLLGKPGY